jgi:hypothetical protein
VGAGELLGGKWWTGQSVRKYMAALVKNTLLDPLSNIQLDPQLDSLLDRPAAFTAPQRG